MAELLNFKRGLHANLPTSVTPGTIYVTTDEQAMYVDVSVTENDSVVNKRIRLGDIIQVASYAEWQKMAPPYSQTALYYIIEQNALLKYTGDGTTHSWKQINSTSTLTENLDKLTARVVALETSTATNAANIKSLDEAIYGTLAEDGTRSEDGLTHSIEANTAAIGEINTALAGKASTSDVEAVSTALSDYKTEQAKTDAAQDTLITGLRTDVDKKATQADLEALAGRVTTNEDDIATLKTTVAGKADASALTTLSGTVDTLSGKVTSNETNIATLSSTVSGHTTSISEINTALDSKADSSTVTTLSGKVDQNTSDIALKASKSDLEALQGTVNSQATSITNVTNRVTNLETTVGSETSGLVKAVADNTTEISNVKKSLESLATNDTINALADRVTTVEGKVKTLEDANLITRVTNAETNITDLTNNKADKSTVEELAEVVDSKAAQADLEAAVQDIADLKTTVGDTNSGLVQAVAQNTSNISANSTAIAGIKSELDTAETGIKARLTAVEDKATTNAGNIQTNANNIQTNADAIATINTTIGADDNSGLRARIKANETAIAGLQTSVSTKAEQDYVDDQIGDIKSYIDQQMSTADAMEFMGSVDDYSKLPTTGVEKGHTYVVSGSFTVGQTVYHAGDMLVASADQGEEETYTGGWTHVQTGYIAAHESKLSGENNQILLTSYTASEDTGDLGKITFAAAADSNVTVSVANDTVTIGMAWGTF